LTIKIILKENVKQAADSLTLKFLSDAFISYTFFYNISVTIFNNNGSEFHKLMQ